MPENEHGAFLIRDSESRHNDYSLSGCDTDTLLALNGLFLLIFFFVVIPVRDGDTVKHYRIRQLDEGGFFIARRTTFRYGLFSFCGLAFRGNHYDYLLST